MATSSNMGIEGSWSKWHVYDATAIKLKLRRGGNIQGSNHSTGKQEKSWMQLLQGSSPPVGCHLIWQGIHIM